MFQIVLQLNCPYLTGTDAVRACRQLRLPDTDILRLHSSSLTFTAPQGFADLGWFPDGSLVETATVSLDILTPGDGTLFEVVPGGRSIVLNQAGITVQHALNLFARAKYLELQATIATP